ncbi:hypothetical protein C8R47DRAFT_993571 [Mycena vitilis]|nr:hypothetical protein C8R47DRAFT_993571 [Mycena vitilis]
MLALPQPADGEETIEGCPVVRLPDSAEDVTCCLRAIFDSSYFGPSPSKPDFCTVISILRRGNKYGVDYLRRRALVHLSSGGPMTLSEYDEGYDTSSIADTLSGTQNGLCILAVRIARESDVPWILPSLFYTLAETRPTYIRRILDGGFYEGQLAKLSEGDRILLLKSNATHDLLCFLHTPDTIPGCEGKLYASSSRLVERHWPELKSASVTATISL